jgi:hypothetical protein
MGKTTWSSQGSKDCRVIRGRVLFLILWANSRKRTPNLVVLS